MQHQEPGPAQPFQFRCGQLDWPGFGDVTEAIGASLQSGEVDVGSDQRVGIVLGVYMVVTAKLTMFLRCKPPDQLHPYADPLTGLRLNRHLQRHIIRPAAQPARPPCG